MSLVCLHLRARTDATRTESRLDPKTAFEGSSKTKQFPAFPEWEIVCEPEPYEESYLPGPLPSPISSFPTQSKFSAEPVQSGIEGEMGPDDEAEPDTVSGVDGAFLRFQERIQRMPEQVLRYVLPSPSFPPSLLTLSRTVSIDFQVSTVPLLCGSHRIRSSLRPFLNVPSVDLPKMSSFKYVPSSPDFYRMLMRIIGIVNSIDVLGGL